MKTSEMTVWLRALAITAALGFGAAVTGCASDGTFEEAGEEVDEAVEEVDEEI